MSKPLLKFKEPQTFDMSDCLKAAEVAKMLRCSTDCLALWRLKRKGPKSFHIGRRLWYRRSDVNAWIQECYYEDNP